MPVWLGWLIGFSPLAGLLVFLVAEGRRLARLRASERASRESRSVQE